MHAHLHARALTADRAAAVLAEQLVARKVLLPQAEPRNASELVGQVQRAVEGGPASPVRWWSTDWTRRARKRLRSLRKC